MPDADLNAFTMTGELVRHFPVARGRRRSAARADSSSVFQPARNLIYAGRSGFVGDRTGRTARRGCRIRQLACDRRTWWRSSPATPCSSTWAPRPPTSSRSGTAPSRTEGYTDAERLMTGRTRLYRLHPHLPVRRGLVGAGARQADAADERVFRLDRRRAPDPGRARRDRTTSIPPPTARKRPSPASMARLARMVGRDAADLIARPNGATWRAGSASSSFARCTTRRFGLLAIWPPKRRSSAPERGAGRSGGWRSAWSGVSSTSPTSSPPTMRCAAKRAAPHRPPPWRCWPRLDSAVGCPVAMLRAAQ